MRTRALALAALTVGSLLASVRTAVAQQGIFSGVQAGMDATFSSIVTRITFASGAAARTTSTNVYPVFRLNMNTLLYPSLQLTIGDVYEVNSLASRTGPVSTDYTATGHRPYFLLRSTKPALSPGVGYFRRAARARTAGLADVTLTSDEYDAYLGWQPAGGPRTDLQFIRTNTFDGQRVHQNTESNVGSAISQYRYQGLGLYYRGFYQATTDRISGSRSRQTTSTIRGDYAQSFIDKRLVWNTTGNLSRQGVQTWLLGTGGEVAVPVTPFAGLSAISDTPVTARLSPNGQLIDGTLDASAGIDLGVPATTPETQLRNIGIDLLTPTEANRFLLWVDRSLPVEISNTYSWDIYSSADNVVWRYEATVPLAPFGVFDNRFEINFPTITARFLKVATRPLSPAAPDSSRFQDIFVTELQVFVRRQVDEANTRVSQNSYVINTDVRLRLLDAPGLYYEAYYLANGRGGLTVATDTLSNGVSMNHAFGRFFSTFARYAREQGRQRGGYRVSNVTSATLTFEPTHTFRTSVLWSGMDERVADVPNARRGLFVQNAAQPYRGVDLLFGFGWTSTNRDTGEISRDRIVNVSAVITPRTSVSVTLNYDLRNTTVAGAFAGAAESRQHRSYVALTIDPVQTLHVVIGGEVVARTGEATRTTLNVNTSWAPFPDGTLQLIFAYNEFQRALEFGQDRNAVMAVRWNLRRGNYVDVSYQRARSADTLQKTESSILGVHLRLFL